MITTESLPPAFQTSATNGRHELRVDAPVEKGGGGQGFSAHELLETALAACVNMAVRMYATQHSIPLERVRTHSRLLHPDASSVRFEYAIELFGPLSESQRAHLQAAAQDCPVRHTLSRRIEFRAGPLPGSAHPTRQE